MTYEMDIAGLKRALPLCKLNDDLSIGAFVIFGDVELTVHCAAELLKRAPEYDYLIAPEAKAIPLLYEMARQSKAEKYFIARGAGQAGRRHRGGPHGGPGRGRRPEPGRHHRAGSPAPLQRRRHPEGVRFVRSKRTPAAKAAGVLLFCCYGR